MKLISVCLLSFLIFLVSRPAAFAVLDSKLSTPSDGEVNEALAKTVPIRFLPGNLLYLTIPLKETVNRFFQPSSVKRAQFDLVLSSKRLKESYLLFLKNDAKGATKNLLRYSGRIDKMVDQLEKARSQNQDVVTLVSEMAEGMRNQETLLGAIWEKEKGDRDNFDKNFERAVISFRSAISAIDNVKPGLKDRFKIATFSSETKTESSSSTSPSPSPDIASPSAVPRRIIY